ncbi:MAG: tetratricopeptide repeat protein, partial [Hylemonella sp.]|nr:tetratricopeptide repeat protein [Hylemonella sp.]
MTSSNDAPTHDADPAAELLARAIACHQDWRFDEAQALYEEVLQLDPQQADAHHNLGVLLAVQLLRAPEALPHFEAALNADAS